MNRKKINITVIIVLILTALIGGYFQMIKPVDSKDTSIHIVKIEQGAGRNSVAALLKKENLIRSEFAFKLISKTGGYDNKYKVGEYGITKSMSSEEILRLICSGKSYGKLFTLPEGIPVYKLTALLEDKGIGKKEKFEEEIMKGNFSFRFGKYLPKKGRAGRLEGFLYPDTYKIGGKQTPHEIIQMFLKNFEERVGDSYFKSARKKGLTPLEAVTLASIVEKEAKTRSDKKKVASVIYNRIKVGMPLQMDSILSYIHKKDKIKASLSDTKVKSSYNPYKNKRLPPGPICNPGKDSLDAAIDPANTEYLYFVASPKLDGTNVFSKKYKNFLKDKAKFDKAYKQYIKKHPGKE